MKDGSPGAEGMNRPQARVPERDRMGKPASPGRGKAAPQHCALFAPAAAVAMVCTGRNGRTGRRTTEKDMGCGTDAACLADEIRCSNRYK